MKCPCCKFPLVRKKYEGVNIHACDKCKGTLVHFDRMKAIESRREKTEDHLMNELINAGEDTDRKIRCSRCLSNFEKISRNIGNETFSVDRCMKCKLMWLDAGELAKLQVIYQFSDQGEEAKRFRDRLNNMTDEEKREYEERIAGLREENLALEIIEGLSTDWRISGIAGIWDLFDQ